MTEQQRELIAEAIDILTEEPHTNAARKDALECLSQCEELETYRFISTAPARSLRAS